MTLRQRVAGCQSGLLNLHAITMGIEVIGISFFKHFSVLIIAFFRIALTLSGRIPFRLGISLSLILSFGTVPAWKITVTVISSVMRANLVVTTADPERNSLLG